MEPTQPQSLEDLAQIIGAYNQVTEKLQKSHELLGKEVVRLQKELASADVQLQRSRRLSALGEMAAGIAHEIRNPLAAIQLYANMLSEDLSGLSKAGDGDQPLLLSAEDSTGKIASAVRGLNGIVHDVLSYSRELNPHPKTVKVDTLLARVLEANEPGIEAGGIQVHLPALGRGHQVKVDPQLMHQALVNLVRNGVQAMLGLGGTLTLDCQVQQEQMLLIVSDTGPGISASQVDRIFNPFYTTRNTGTGLGLSIVHRIVEVHDGTIAVANGSAGGAVFTLSVPVGHRLGNGNDNDNGSGSGSGNDMAFGQGAVENCQSENKNKNKNKNHLEQAAALAGAAIGECGAMQ